MHILKKVMHCDHLFISSFEKNAGQIYSVFAMENTTILDVSSFPPVYLEPEGQGTQSRVLRSGKSLLSNDWQSMFISNNNRYYIEDDGTAFTPEQLPDDAEITRSGIIVPIIFQEQVIGAIQILSIFVNTYSENDLRIAEALASQIAVASNNAILYRRAQFEIEERKRSDENIKRQVERLMAISEFDRMIGSSFNLDNHLPKLTELVCTYLHVDAALILLVDAPAQELAYAMSYGFTQPAIKELRIGLGADSVGRSRLEENRLAAFDLHEAGVHLSQAKFWQAEGFHSFYAVPLNAKGVLKGVWKSSSARP
ncbi:MAG: GAF domain-containing protein [Holophaga sp.]|nr:GAF domain-containing protein [Holophaga sp.]